MQIEQAIEKSYANAEARHFVNAPSHAKAMVHQLHGQIEELDRILEDDPLLYAYQCLDRLPLIAGELIAIEKWCVAVREATPDQIQEHGAQLCP